MDVLYEDSSLIVCKKPAGMLSTPKEGSKEENLLSLFSAMFAARGKGEVAYPVHRLDRQTSGVMVFAKTKQAAAALSAAAAGDGMKKEYLAVTEGIPEKETEELCDLLFFDRARDKTFVVTRMRRGVHEATLSYRTLAALPATGNRPPLALLHVQLGTGRTHQIRAQLASRHLPLYGDARYGAKTRGNLGLFAYTLTLTHPQSGKQMCFEGLLDEALPFSLFKDIELCKF